MSEVNPTVRAVDSVYNFKKATDSGYTYFGESEPGSATSEAVWRISRMTDADCTIVWADGDGHFDNVWDDYLSLSYS